MSFAARLVPGIGRVHAQSIPFAKAWQASNADALAGDGPLWVALGDSMSQGIGARDITGGWVGQLHTRITSAGKGFRLVNLSKTGARVGDVLDEQLSQLRDLGLEPDLTTVLVGANDMLRRSRREAAVEHFEQLVAELPAGATVIATLPRRNKHALAINALVDDASAAGLVRVADMRGRTLASLSGTRADDHFHPNERGYASIADAFARALGLPEGPR